MNREPSDQTRFTLSGNYVREAFQTSDLVAVLVRNSSRQQTLQRIAPVARVMDSGFQNWLTFKNESESCDIYIGMNPLKPGARTRTKNDIRAIRHLYVDLDRDGAKALAIIERSNQFPRPTFLLRTSPGKFQVIWHVEGFGLDQAETLLRGLARKLGGDPAATDSARVLRLPGFVNRKYDDAFVVTWEHLSPDTYQPRNFRVKFDLSEPDHRDHRDAAARRLPTERPAVSQSDRDWAFAKRALLRGEEADDIIRQIARFRTGEKPDPGYYARHTVMKALRELAGTLDGNRVSSTPQSLLPQRDSGQTQS
jgi:hypothetical protein